MVQIACIRVCILHLDIYVNSKHYKNAYKGHFNKTIAENRFTNEKLSFMWIEIQFLHPKNILIIYVCWLDPRAWNVEAPCIYLSLFWANLLHLIFTIFHCIGRILLKIVSAGTQMYWNVWQCFVQWTWCSAIFPWPLKWRQTQISEAVYWPWIIQCQRLHLVPLSTSKYMIENTWSNHAQSCSPCWWKQICINETYIN